MKKFAAACVLACALIAVIAGPAGAHTTTRGAAQAAGPITFGVADDTGKYADDGGAWFNQQLKGANLTEELFRDRAGLLDGSFRVLVADVASDLELQAQRRQMVTKPVVQLARDA